MQATKSKRSHEPASAKPAGNIAVEFILDMPQANAVTVAGEFNNWDISQKPLRKNGDGIWHGTVTLQPGRYEYRFVVDGQWINEPTAKESNTNCFGSENSVRVVAQPTIPLLLPTANEGQSDTPPRRQVRT